MRSWMLHYNYEHWLNPFKLHWETDSVQLMKIRELHQMMKCKQNITKLVGQNAIGSQFLISMQRKRIVMEKLLQRKNLRSITNHYVESARNEKMKHQKCQDGQVQLYLNLGLTQSDYQLNHIESGFRRLKIFEWLSQRKNQKPTRERFEMP